MTDLQKNTERAERRLKRLVMWLCSTLTQWLSARKRDKALKRFGWDAECPGCGRRYHADDCGKCLGETLWHWFYVCDCGRAAPWAIGIAPCPVLNEPQREGWPNWREELENDPYLKAEIETHNAGIEARCESNVASNDLLCAACQKRGKTWNGSDARCAFVTGCFFGDNWNCATSNMIRDICDEAQELPGYVDYQYCDDQKYATICIDDVEGIEGTPLALWVSWYKNRGGTDAMWLLFETKPPRKPTEAECLLIVAWHKAHNASLQVSEACAAGGTSPARRCSEASGKEER